MKKYFESTCGEYIIPFEKVVKVHKKSNGYITVFNLSSFSCSFGCPDSQLKSYLKWLNKKDSFFFRVFGI